MNLKEYLTLSHNQRVCIIKGVCNLWPKSKRTLKGRRVHSGVPRVSYNGTSMEAWYITKRES